MNDSANASASDDGIASALEEALAQLGEKIGEKTVARIRSIIFTNLERGRVHTYLDRNEEARPSEYITLVAGTYERLSPLIHQVQVVQSSEVWQPLFEHLQSLAYTFLLNKNFKAGQHTFEQAITCATEAAVQVSRAHFPYDTEFEPWVHVLLRNVCFGYLRRLKKERSLNDNLVDLNQLLEIIPAEPSNQWLEQAQITRQELEEAINRLQEVRQIVIREHHFNGRSFAEIAEDIDKSTNNVYQIHYRALDDLRKILQQKGYI